MRCHITFASIRNVNHCEHFRSNDRVAVDMLWCGTLSKPPFPLGGTLSKTIVSLLQIPTEILQISGHFMLRAPLWQLHYKISLAAGW